MKKYRIGSKKQLIAVTGTISVILITMVCFITQNTKIKVAQVDYESIIDILEPNNKRELTEEELNLEFIKENEVLIDFMADTFAIDKDILKNKLIKEQNGLYLQDKLEVFLIDYLTNLEGKEKKLFNNKIVPCKNDKEYIVSLIKYFTSIYPEVDFEIAAGIADVESNYTSTVMLNVNNIFGGMYSGGLLKYKNIEYGVLKYIKLLNDGYFTKGLTTVESIGKIYNPTYDSNGQKIAKPVWVTNVNRAMEKYGEFGNVDVNLLNALKNKTDSIEEK